MRAFFAVLVGVSLFAFWALVVFGRTRLNRRRSAKARWQVRIYHRDGRTLVALGLMTTDSELLDEQLVAQFSDVAPDWDAQFLAARETAMERAFHLNASLDGVT
jgi:hypothetical protein